ncbi:MAG: 50S ribosomal protein L21 [bacterium]
MLAIVNYKGKQFQVKKGDDIVIPKTNKKEKSQIDLGKVLLVGDSKGTKIGTPYVKDAKVTAEIVADYKAKKVISGKFKAKKRYRRRIGNRQKYTKVKITEIKG